MHPLILLVIILIVVLILMYNHLVTLGKRAEESLADIDVQLKRRYDLIPNLIETVKGYATHEDSVFNEVTKARALAMQGGNLEEREAHENQLTGTLKSLFAVSENYPELKANENFLALQDELTNTENRIQAARRFYNMNIKAYNTRIAQVPFNLLASLFHFGKKDFFEVREAKELAPVEIDFNQ